MNLEDHYARKRLIEQKLALKELQRWRPRVYQDDMWQALHSGRKRFVAVWHRRAGKDTTFLHWTVESLQDRPGVYWHMLPTAKQGRKVVWDGRTKEGIPFLDAWKADGLKIVKRREDEMKLDILNEESGKTSIWQVVGSDNYDSLVGANPIGVVFSEYAVADPRAWDYIRPILAENGGWACFPYTPRGRNHGADLYEMALGNPDWFVSRLTVDDTRAISPEDIQAERDAGMSDEMIEQEFFCSFDAPLHGSFYGKEMAQALEEGRITNVKPDSSASTFTWWDIGRRDTNAIWFAQMVGLEIHLIDYYENSGVGLPHYAEIIQQKQQEHNLVYEAHLWPHDGGNTEYSTNKPRPEAARELGLHVLVQPREANIMPGIDRVRSLLDRCWFDKERCARGIACLREYKKEEDENKGTKIGGEVIRYYKQNALHNWASHGADAFRTGAVALDGYRARRTGPIKYPDNHISTRVV